MNQASNAFTITETKNQIEQLKRLYHKEMGMLQQLKQSQKEKEEEIQRLQEDQTAIELKRIILQEASDEAREQAKEILESVATTALQFIMGDHVTLEIELDQKGNSPTASFFIKKIYGDYEIKADPTEEDGGGLADVVAFSLMIAMLQLAGGSNVSPLFLDEPSKYVSKGHSDKVANFLYDVSRSFERQVFMVTHDEFLANIGDTSYHFRIENGKTVVTQIS